MSDKPSMTTQEAAAFLNRDDASWEASLGQATVLTYAFRTHDDPVSQIAGDGFSEYSAAQIQATVAALQSWSDVADIQFTRVSEPGSEYSDNATILFGNVHDTSETSFSGAVLIGPSPDPSYRLTDGPNSIAGDVWTNTARDFIVSPELFNKGALVLDHEIGHALGLLHAGEYNGQGADYERDAAYREDTLQYSVMSYFSETNTGADYGGLFPSAPQLFDIAAMQRLYGANLTTRTGDTTYGFHANADRPWFVAAGADAPLIFCVWDAGGTDTFDFSGYHVRQVIDLHNEAFSSVGGLSGNVSISAAVLDDLGRVVNLIENAIGGAAKDQISGNEAANKLSGGGGGDTLSGRDGDDLIVGGRGADTMFGGLGADTFELDRLSDSAGRHLDWIVDIADEDVIDLRRIDADVTQDGDQAFHLVSRFHGHAGELWLHYGPGHFQIDADVDGDKRADLTIIIDDAHGDFSHFVL